MFAIVFYHKQGDDGLPRDLHKAAQCLQKAIQFEQGGDDLRRHLNAVYAKIQKEGGASPSPQGTEGKKLAWGTPQNQAHARSDFSRPRHANGLESPRHRPMGIPERGGSNRSMGGRRESYQSVQSLGQSMGGHSMGGHSMGSRRESHSSTRSLRDHGGMGGRKESQISVQHEVNGIEVQTLVAARSQSPSARRPRVTDYDKDLWDDEDDHLGGSVQHSHENARSQDDSRSMKSAGSRRTSRSRARHDHNDEIRQVILESPRRSRDRDSPGLQRPSYSPRRDSRGPPRM